MGPGRHQHAPASVWAAGLAWPEAVTVAWVDSCDITRTGTGKTQAVLETRATLQRILLKGISFVGQSWVQRGFTYSRPQRVHGQVEHTDGQEVLIRLVWSLLLAVGEAGGHRGRRRQLSLQDGAPSDAMRGPTP